MINPITVQFSQGIQFPPKLGTLILKKTSEGKLAFAQNVNSNNDEYGTGTITPGPGLTIIGNNSELTGVPFVKAFWGFSAGNVGHLYFAQGLSGVKTVIRRVKNILSGFTPEIDTTGSMTIDHSSHVNQNIVDMILRPDSGNSNYIYVTGKDDTDTWVYKFIASTGSPTLFSVTTNANFTSGIINQFFVLGSDNKIYWIGHRRVTSINEDDSITVLALANGLPLGANATAGVNWKEFLWVIYSTELGGSFDARLSGGRSAIIRWDYSSPSFQGSPIPAPFRYCPAMMINPNGNLIVFGGVDEGKSSLYEFTGYGFNLIYTYIGDLPRSRHSVEFDGQGRILWLTADGQFLRLDISNKVFDHLGSI